MSHVAAIVLAGGEARRLGGRSKPDLEVGGRRLLDIVLSATAPAAPRVVVAGPEVAVPASVLRVQEHPPRSGPAAGILAGLRVLTELPGGAPTWVLVLACDLPGASGLVDRLLGATASLPGAGAGTDGAILTHPDGTREWLAALVRTDALAESGRRLGDAANRSVRSLLGPLSLTELPTDGLETGDIDTMEDHRRAEQVRAERPRKPPVTRSTAYETTLLPWIREASAATGVDPGLVDVDTIHDLTGEIAHRLDRSMAPIGAFIAALALTRGDRDLAEVRTLIEATLPAAPAPAVPASPETAR